MPINGICSQCGKRDDLFSDETVEYPCDWRCSECHEEMVDYYRQKSRDAQVFWFLLALILGIVACVIYGSVLLLPKG